MTDAPRACELRGPTAPWTRLELLALALLAGAALWLRLHALGAEGFADDEIHKWLAAQRYLQGDFGGDDLEHPMVMKGLIALCIALFRGHLSPETITRLPNVLASPALVVSIALLGRRLYGKAVALVAAGICALSAVEVGYGRIAKEDVLFTVFFVLAIWALCEARVAADAPDPRAQNRWELLGAAMLGASFASKYFVFVIVLVPMLYFALRPGSAWRAPLKRWVVLSVVAAAVMLALDWVVLTPAAWRYIAMYLGGGKGLGDRGTSESYLFMGRLWDNFAFHVRGESPWWFYLAFAAVKFAPTTAAFMAGGLGLALWRRAPSDRVIVVWIAFMIAVWVVSGAKYARYFTSMMPAFAFAAGEAARALAARLRDAKAQRSALAGFAVAIFASEGWAAVTHEPHPRLYISPLAGGDAKLDYWFPHCDYFDAGVREAVQQIAARAEPGAEVTGETVWVNRWYLDQAGRSDVSTTPSIAARACLSGKVCYVIAEAGRRYWHNEAALDHLAAQPPWTTIEVGGHAAVRVYRLEPGAPLFPAAPPDGQAAARR